MGISPSSHPTGFMGKCLKAKTTQTNGHDRNQNVKLTELLNKSSMFFVLLTSSED